MPHSSSRSAATADAGLERLDADFPQASPLEIAKPVQGRNDNREIASPSDAVIPNCGHDNGLAVASPARPRFV